MDLSLLCRCPGIILQIACRCPTETREQTQKAQNSTKVGTLGPPRIQPKRDPWATQTSTTEEILGPHEYPEFNHRGKTQGYPEFNRSGIPWATQNSTKVGSLGTRRGGWTRLTFVNNPLNSSMKSLTKVGRTRPPLRHTQLKQLHPKTVSAV